MAQGEKVLVIRRRVIEQPGIFNGLIFDVQKYLSRIFEAGVPFFMERSEAEENPDYKQLIPYVIMACNGTFLTYVRGKRAGETRLVGNRSIGIGGHINPSDDMPLFGDLGETYLAAVKREVAEEVSVQTDFTDHIVALLNDESNPVGQVHLGVVHYWRLKEPNVQRREQMITQMSFMTVQQLQQVRPAMETWSQLCLDGLEKMAK